MLALVIAEFIALLVFGAVDFLRTRSWDGYQTSIVLILVYALIRGKKDLASLDVWVGRRFQRWQSRQYHPARPNASSLGSFGQKGRPKDCPAAGSPPGSGHQKTLPGR